MWIICEAVSGLQGIECPRPLTDAVWAMIAFEHSETVPGARDSLHVCEAGREGLVRWLDVRRGEVESQVGRAVVLEAVRYQQLRGNGERNGGYR